MTVIAAFQGDTKREEETSNLVRCLIEIIESVNSVKKLAVFGAEGDALIEKILKSVQVPVIINAEEMVKSGVDRRERNDFILILNTTFTVTDLLITTHWDAETRFILMCKEHWDELIFQQFWKKKVINVFALVEHDVEVLLYSFLPFGVNGCNTAHKILLDRWSRGRFLGSGLIKIHDGVTITNMNNCPVNVTVVDVKPQVFFQDECSCNGTHQTSGIEGNIMKEIGKKLNMELMYVTAVDGIGWGWIEPKPSGVVGEVYTGRSEFGIGLLAPTVERFENLDLSVHYNGHECITYGVPKGAGAKQPAWIMILIFEFEGIMWFLIILVFIFVLFQFELINKALKLSLFRNNFDFFMYLFGACLGTPVKVQESFTQRITVISWIIFTFIITVAYRSSMGSKLTVPTPDPDINTFKDLLKSNLRLTGYNNMLRLMQYNDSEPEIKLMAERFEVTYFDIDQAVYDIARHRNIAHVRHVSTFLYYSLISAEARGHIHVLEDCIYRYYPIFVMKKNSPFTKLTNRVILNLYETGIIKYWKSWYMYDFPKKPNTFEKLSLEHTFGMFFIILIGYLLAITFFIAELIYCRLRASMNMAKIKKLFLAPLSRQVLVRKGH